jgi:cyclopropane-fatty-acyl-phospholipid synthase
MVARTVSVLNQIFPSPRNFTVRLWDGSELPAELNSNFSLILNHPGSLRRMFAIPIELALGEAFIYSDIDLEGDIFSAFPLLNSITGQSFSFAEIATLSRKILSFPRSGPERPAERGSARMRGKLHSLKRDRAAIQYHYDVGNDFYSLWLDRNLQYSCAYFSTGTEDLDTAQERKLEYICRKLRLKSGERLLDIGCGWGGLAMHAAEKYDVRVLGVTLSEQQANYANYQIAHAGLGHQASVKFQDYRDRGGESFDKIVSVGMFEHVGRSHLPEYFAQAFRLLKPGGLFLNHGISRRTPAPRVTTTGRNACHGRPSRTGDESGWQKFFERRIMGAGSFIQRRIFPDSELVPISEINLAAEQAGFEVRDVENLREHYALTLRHWVNRLEAHRAEAIKTVGEVIYRTWRLYMAASVYGFESGLINVNQTLLAKPDQGNSGLPLTRADWYFSEKQT